MFKLHFDLTVHNSIRIWLKYEESKKRIVQNSWEFKTFQLLSCWGGFDKQDEGLYSWELPLPLSEWVKDRFKYYKECKIQLP